MARGLTPGRKRWLDHWVTAHLAVRKSGWPDGGVRALLKADGALVLVLAVPSEDAVGRRYPLLAVTSGSGLSFEVAEAWCDRAEGVLRAAIEGRTSPDVPFAGLQAFEPALRAGPQGESAIWSRGGTPEPPDIETLDALFDEPAQRLSSD